MKERENLLSAFLQQDIGKDGIIFIDNLDVTEHDEPYIQTLTNTECRVVCSSRITDFDFFEPVRIDLLTSYDAQLLFLSYYNPGIRYEQYSSLEQNYIRGIVEKLAYHTLTIEVIAKIGRVEKQTLENILNNLDRVGLNFSGIAKVNFTEKTLIGHLCRIFSIRKLGLKHRQILGAIALYPLNQVPKEVLYWLDIQNNTMRGDLSRVFSPVSKQTSVLSGSHGIRKILHNFNNPDFDFCFLDRNANPHILFEYDYYSSYSSIISANRYNNCNCLPGSKTAIICLERIRKLRKWEFHFALFS